MSRARRKPQLRPVGRWRRHGLSALVLVGAVLMLGRAFDLQVLDRAFLESEGAKRAARHVEMPAHRGAVRDRHGEPLALSAPVDSVWVSPSDLLAAPRHLSLLAQLLERDASALRKDLEARSDRQFYWLARHLPPAKARRIEALQAPGVGLMREYRRFYPAGEITAQLVGLTNIDGKGLEGVEAAADELLAGRPGKRRVVRARDGRVLESGVPLVEPRPGADVHLTIDLRLQYLAHRELKKAVLHHDAKGGMVVVADVESGEILAMASQPGFNPNQRDRIPASALRNRVLTDVFEPGSTVKPLLVAQALEAGLVRQDRRWDTGDGWMQVGRLTVRDVRAYGVVDLQRMLQKSSNVAAARLGLEMGAEQVFQAFERFGFSSPLYLGMPGVGSGKLNFWKDWGEIATVTASYGYGLSTTALHLLRAYAALAGDGRMPGLRLRADAPAAPPERVLSAEVARQLRQMLTTVVSAEGTASRAAVPGFQVAGKTGTTHKSVDGGYAKDRYQSQFIGMVPAGKPRLVGLVLIDEPRREGYFGGAVAGPVFSAVMHGAAHWLRLPPEQLPEPTDRLRTARAEGLQP